MNGGTNISLAIQKAGQLLKPLSPTTQRVLVLLTDGRIDSHQVGSLRGWVKRGVMVSSAVWCFGCASKIGPLLPLSAPSPQQGGRARAPWIAQGLGMACSGLESAIHTHTHLLVQCRTFLPRSPLPTLSLPNPGPGSARHGAATGRRAGPRLAVCVWCGARRGPVGAAAHHLSAGRGLGRVSVSRPVHDGRVAVVRRVACRTGATAPNRRWRALYSY